MCFLHFIKKNHRIWVFTNSFSQLTTGFITHITGRSTHQTSHGMFLTEFGHIYSNHSVLIIEQEFSKSFSKLGFSRSRRSQEQERTSRSLRIAHTRTRTTYSIRNSLHSIILVNNLFANHLFHFDQFLSFTFKHFANRNTSPRSHNSSNLISTHKFRNKRVLQNNLLFFFDLLNFLINSRNFFIIHC